MADRLAGLATAAREAFTSGMQGAAIAGAVLLVGAAGLAALTLRGVEVRKGLPEPEPEKSLA